MKFRTACMNLSLEELRPEMEGQHMFSIENGKSSTKKKIGHFARECRTKGNQDSKRRDAWNSGNKDGRRSEEEEDYALMACNSSGSDTEMSANDKFGLGYGDYKYDGILSYENEVLQIVFMNKEETSEFVTEIVVNEPKVVSQPKVCSDAPIIEEYESDSKDEHVSLPTAKNRQKHIVLLNQNQAVLTNVARKISTVKPFVNRVRPKTVFHKTHSPFRRPFNNTTALRTKFSKQKVNTAEVNAVSAIGGKGKLLLSPQQVVIRDHKDTTGTKSPNTMVDQDYPHRALQNKGIVDSGCSRHMTGNKAYLAEYQDFNGGPVAFGGSKGYITGKGKIKTGKLDFEDVCFVKELQHFNLFSVSQICDKKNKVLFTDSECLVLSPEFKLPDANQVLLRIPRQNNMYSFNLENIVPSGGLACLIAKATIDESNKWHRRLGHVNFKNLNKLVKGNLVRGLPSKIFQNDHTCVACQKGKQHKASCKAKSVSSISQPLQLLHMDLFGPTSRKDQLAIDLDYLIDSMNYQPVRSENQANKHAGPQEANQNASTEDNIDAGDSEIEDANDAAEALMKELAQETKDLLLQAEAAKASNDSEIPALEEIYDNPTDGIFTNPIMMMRVQWLTFTNLNPEELLQFKIQKVWILVDLPYEKKAIGTKWVYKNKKDDRGLKPLDLLKPCLLHGIHSKTSYGCEKVAPPFPPWSIKDLPLSAVSVLGLFSVQKNLDHSDDFQGVIWVLESHWEEL
ncbi:ribonuclease H-like domain-containing protein [Tanacetum coccineum]